MFTGIIEETGTVQQVKNLDGGRELTICCSFAGELKIDQSICINGACHTVTGLQDESFTIQSVEETLRKTNIGMLKEEDRANLERSMTLQKLLDGHIVQGHVDSTGTIERIEKEGTDRLFTISYPESFSGLIVGRGSVTVDGISLTVARDEENSFMVAVIPYTFDHTNFNQKSEGDTVNLEFDILGKYVAKQLGKARS